ncbi:hypothetical protein BB560_001333 [Smittium megazygosporum]|uniref:RRM domain-containing protein n=1 Tax=Smittium megazygosporum TaxID=133381 RepID=A0A2T9ZHZ1_9FUNG|nr:hypothetical protein BB560_001333 [Smittium megazygosporum]
MSTYADLAPFNKKGTNSSPKKLDTPQSQSSKTINEISNDLESVRICTEKPNKSSDNLQSTTYNDSTLFTDKLFFSKISNKDLQTLTSRLSSFGPIKKIVDRGSDFYVSGEFIFNSKKDAERVFAIINGYIDSHIFSFCISVRKNTSFQLPDTNPLKIIELPLNSDIVSLYDLLKSAGPIFSISITDLTSRNPKDNRYGYVQYLSSESTENAINKLTYSSYKGVLIYFKYKSSYAKRLNSEGFNKHKSRPFNLIQNNPFIKNQSDSLSLSPLDTQLRSFSSSENPNQKVLLGNSLNNPNSSMNPCSTDAILTKDKYESNQKDSIRETKHSPVYSEQYPPSMLKNRSDSDLKSLNPLQIKNTENIFPAFRTDSEYQVSKNSACFKIPLGNTPIIINRPDVINPISTNNRVPIEKKVSFANDVSCLNRYRPQVFKNDNFDSVPENRWVEKSTYINDRTKTQVMLYIRNLNPSVSQHDLYKLFKNFGYVITTKVDLDPDTKLSCCCGEVLMRNIAQATNALINLNGTYFKGKKIVVSKTDSNQNSESINEASNYNPESKPVPQYECRSNNRASQNPLLRNENVPIFQHSKSSSPQTLGLAKQSTLRNVHPERMQNISTSFLRGMHSGFETGSASSINFSENESPLDSAELENLSKYSYIEVLTRRIIAKLGKFPLLDKSLAPEVITFIISLPLEKSLSSFNNDEQFESLWRSSNQKNRKYNLDIGTLETVYEIWSKIQKPERSLPQTSTRTKEVSRLVDIYNNNIIPKNSNNIPELENLISSVLNLDEGERKHKLGLKLFPIVKGKKEQGQDYLNQLEQDIPTNLKRKFSEKSNPNTEKIKDSQSEQKTGSISTAKSFLLIKKLNRECSLIIRALREKNTKENVILDTLNSKLIDDKYISLVPMEEFMKGAPPNLKEGLDDPHKLQLSRLKYEIAVRKDLKKQRDMLSQKRDMLIAKKKLRAEYIHRLQNQVNTYVKSADILREAFGIPKINTEQE